MSPLYRVLCECFDLFQKGSRGCLKNDNTSSILILGIGIEDCTAETKASNEPFSLLHTCAEQYSLLKTEIFYDFLRHLLTSTLAILPF